MNVVQSFTPVPEIVAVRRSGDGRTLLVDAEGRQFAVVARVDGFRRGRLVELVQVAERVAA